MHPTANCRKPRLKILWRGQMLHSMLSTMASQAICASQPPLGHQLFHTFTSYSKRGHPEVVIGTRLISSSIQFHVMQIQLHRPLTRRRHKQWQASAQVSAEDDVHLKLCWNSAAEISRILRIYESHYKLVSFPSPASPQDN